MKVERLELSFTDDAILEIAKIAFEVSCILFPLYVVEITTEYFVSYNQVNRTVENIGARRLHTVVEKIVEDISYNAPERSNTSFEVTPQYARDMVKVFLHATDLKKYII